MDATSYNYSNPSKLNLNPLYNQREFEVQTSDKVKAAVQEVKEAHAEAVSSHLVLDNIIVKIKSLNAAHQKIYSFGISWFDVKEVQVGQHIKFNPNHQKSMSLFHTSVENTYLLDHFDEEYEVLEVKPVYRDTNAVECEAKSEAEAKCEAETKSEAEAGPECYEKAEEIILLDLLEEIS